MMDIASVTVKMVKTPKWACTLGASVRGYLVYSEFKRIAQKIKEIEELDDYLSSGCSMGKPSEWNIKIINQTLMDNVDDILGLLNGLEEERDKKVRQKNEPAVQVVKGYIQNFRMMLDIYLCKGEERFAAEILG